MKPYFDQIDALRIPSYEAQLADALLTLVLLIALFSLIAGVSWLFVKILERREARRGLFGRVR